MLHCTSKKPCLDHNLSLDAGTKPQYRSSDALGKRHLRKLVVTDVIESIVEAKSKELVAYLPCNMLHEVYGCCCTPCQLLTCTALRDSPGVPASSRPAETPRQPGSFSSRSSEGGGWGPDPPPPGLPCLSLLPGVVPVVFADGVGRNIGPLSKLSSRSCFCSSMPPSKSCNRLVACRACCNHIGLAAEQLSKLLHRYGCSYLPVALSSLLPLLLHQRYRFPFFPSG